MSKKDYSFKKEEKLKSKKAIDQLFKAGVSVHKYPIRWVALQVSPQEYPIKVSFSVSKKKFKKAVDRNRIKRLMREAWRHNKVDYYKDLDNPSYLHIMLIYTSQEIENYQEIKSKMNKGFKKLLSQINK